MDIQLKKLTLHYCWQLENFMGGKDAYQNRVGSLIVPCLAQLAVATRDDSLCKQLNYQVLLKARHKEAQVNYLAN